MNNRQYTIRVHHDLRPWRPWRPWRQRPWWASVDHGVMVVSGTWHAFTREGLIKKCERWINQDAARYSIMNPIIGQKDAV
jgi:hypothetical protein